MSETILEVYYSNSKQHGTVFLDNLSALIDFYLRKYDNYIIIGDMNLEPSEAIMAEFIENYGLQNLILKPTCFKSSRGTCIDLILTNNKSCFLFSDTFETGLSDCHTLIYTTFKSTFSKLPPIKMSYRSYKNFDEKIFREEVMDLINNSLCPYDFSSFYNIIISTLNKHTPCKIKMIRGNNKSFITKRLKKEIWKRSRLKNTANKTRHQFDISQYKRQRNLVTSLVKKEKRKFFNNFELQTDKKKFWEACKPYLSKKFSPGEDRIFLKNNGLLITDEQRIADQFNLFFTNITSTLNIKSWQSGQSGGSEFSTHPSILKIREQYKNDNNEFNFQHVEPETINKVIKNLKKGTGEVPLSIVKLLSEPLCNTICDCINSSINNCVFPDELKWADIIPVFKKGDRGNSENYCPISILPTFNYLRKFYSIKLIYSSKINSLNFYVVSGKVIQRKQL